MRARAAPGSRTGSPPAGQPDRLAARGEPHPLPEEASAAWLWRHAPAEAASRLLLYAAAHGDGQEVVALLRAGVPVEARHPRDGNTPLLEAAMAGQLDTARVLLREGADPNARNMDGRTALGWLYWSGEAPDSPACQIARLLREAGATGRPPPPAVIDDPLAPPATPSPGLDPG